LQATYALNPGLAATFPWLSTLAPAYQQYTIHKIGFEYIPIAPTNTQGDVILSPDYNPSDLAPASEPQACDHRGAVTNVCWDKSKCYFKIGDLHALGAKRYVRTCNTAGDIKTFDSGKFYLSTNNQTSTATIGKLFISYDIEFFVPVSGPTVPTLPLYTSMFGSTSAQVFTTAVAANVVAQQVLYDPLTWLGSTAGGQWSPPAGVYRLSFHAIVVDTAAETFTASLSLLKNGSAVPANNFVAAKILSAAGGFIPISHETIVALSGTDIISYSLTLTGAAGTLSIAGNSIQLLVTLA
jgi:hypothetical protein